MTSAETRKEYDVSRETLVSLLNSSLTRCAWIRERLQRGTQYSTEDACQIREIDDALYNLCLSVQEPE